MHRYKAVQSSSLPTQPSLILLYSMLSSFIDRERRAFPELVLSDPIHLPKVHLRSAPRTWPFEPQAQVGSGG